MGKTNTRKEIHEKFDEALKSGRKLLCGAPGSGLNAKIAEMGGMDIIMILHTGLIRQQGLPSIASPDRPSNEIVKGMFAEQFRVTKEIPILAGVDVGQFPADGDLNELIDSFMDMGFSGIVNFISAGEIASKEFVALAEQNKGTDDLSNLQFNSEMAMFEDCKRKEAAGVGFDREVELIRLCNERGIFTFTYVFTPEQAFRMAEAGADAISAHCGGTAGGTVGHKAVLGYEAAAERLQGMFDAARKANPGIYLFGHGGPFATPADVAEMYKLINADGYVAGSGIDRIPIEQAIMKAVQEFRNI